MKRELIVGPLIVLLGLVYLGLTYNIAMPAGRSMGVVDARFFPYVLGAIICVLGIAQTVVSWRHRSAIAAAPTEPRDRRTLILTAATMVLYVAFIEPIGFILASIVYLVCQFSIMKPPAGGRDLGKYAAIAVIGAVLTYLVFRYYFDMLLPQGLITFI